MVRLAGIEPVTYGLEGQKYTFLTDSTSTPYRKNNSDYKELNQIYCIAIP